MNKTMLLKLAKGLLVLAIVITGQRAMAQYTGEWIICTDGRNPDACRSTQIFPDDTTGIFYWGRDFGNTLCVGVGIVPQDTDCNFLGSSYNGFDCTRVQDTFAARVFAGGDMAIACGDVSPLPDGNYSAKATRSSCFDDVPFCGNFVLYTP